MYHQLGRSATKFNYTSWDSHQKNLFHMLHNYFFRRQLHSVSLCFDYVPTNTIFLVKKKTCKFTGKQNTLLSKANCSFFAARGVRKYDQYKIRELIKSKGGAMLGWYVRSWIRGAPREPTMTRNFHWICVPCRV